MTSIAVLFCFSVQNFNFTEIGQSAAELWQKKTIFKMAAVRHLEFKKLIFGHVTVTEFQISCCVRNVTEIARFFIEIWQFHDFQDGGDPPFTILEIQ